ncbi:MAG: hypothetical protein ACK47O_06960, partial [Betaproteobacteria bacterium]
MIIALMARVTDSISAFTKFRVTGSFDRAGDSPATAACALAGALALALEAADCAQAGKGEPPPTTRAIASAMPMGEIRGAFSVKFSGEVSGDVMGDRMTPRCWQSKVLMVSYLSFHGGGGFAQCQGSTERDERTRPFPTPDDIQEIGQGLF